MASIGYALSSEEHGPSALVSNAQRAEAAGFEFCSLSDHYHPWIDQQGESPFAWCVVGGVAATTSTIRLGTGVTCPTMRIHPAVVAQAAATAQSMMDGRFFLGVGTGENLNEHILGDRWPAYDVRLSMLEEAIVLMRELWTGSQVTFSGSHYTVENARLYTLPEGGPPPVIVAASGEKAAALAGRLGDGLWSTAPDASVVKAFEAAGGSGPRLGQVTVCVGDDVAAARRVAHEWWPNTGLPGQLTQELAFPSLFEDACSLVSEDDVASSVVCGKDVGEHVDKISEFVDAGFDHVYIHQVGPDQDSFFSFYESSVLPRLR